MTHFPRLQDALLYAAELHRGQERDGDAPLPYITHPVEVLLALRTTGGCTNEDLLCVATLHDVVEETEATVAEIEARFGGRVASLVGELTRREPTAEETNGMSKDEIWQLRAETLLDEISKMSPDAQRVKLADRLCNLREAYRTKSGKKIARYEWQTHRILKIIPQDVNVELWESVAAELAGHAGTSG